MKKIETSPVSQESSDEVAHRTKNIEREMLLRKPGPLRTENQLMMICREQRENSTMVTTTADTITEKNRWLKSLTQKFYIQAKKIYIENGI